MRGAVGLVGIGLYYDCLFEILGSPFLYFGHGVSSWVIWNMRV